MNIFNEYGVLTYQPTLDLSQLLDTMIADHCRLLVDMGVPMVEIRALHSYFNAELAISETVLVEASKRRAAARERKNAT